jgi:hypothetical protein
VRFCLGCCACVLWAQAHPPRRWYKNGVVTPVPESLRPTIEALEEHSQIKIATQWVPDEGYNYLSIKFSNNFSSTLTPWVWEAIQHVKTVKGY